MREEATRKAIVVFYEMTKTWNQGDREASRKLAKVLEKYTDLTPPKNKEEKE